MKNLFTLILIILMLAFGFLILQNVGISLTNSRVTELNAEARIIEAETAKIEAKANAQVLLRQAQAQIDQMYHQMRLDTANAAWPYLIVIIGLLVSGLLLYFDRVKPPTNNVYLVTEDGKLPAWEVLIPLVKVLKESPVGEVKVKKAE
jgi:hypothetical protein